MLQLNPTLPITRNLDNMKGYAIAIIDYSQEHDLLFVCAMDNGEIWTYNNKDIKVQKNISLNRQYNENISPSLKPNGTTQNSFTRKFTNCTNTLNLNDNSLPSTNWGNFMSGNPLNDLL
jgi:hypothetical protein